MKDLKTAILSWLGVTAAVCTLISFTLQHIAQMTLVELLTTSVPIPLWVAPPLLFLAGLVCIIAIRRARTPRDYPAIEAHRRPHLITSSRRQSPTPVSSRFLRSPTGSVATWVYLQPFGQGIRKLENNRYIVAHATNRGLTKAVGDKKRYVNVFSLSRGPDSYSPPIHPVWKLWLANACGQEKIWSCEDFEQLEPGWHHFIIRWDHGKPVLELLIDGQHLIARDDYQVYWPEEYDDQVVLGTWPNRNRIHFVETSLWRTLASTVFLDDQWVNRELAIPRPPLP